MAAAQHDRKSTNGLISSARWNLPRQRPLVAPAYSERRSAAAKQIGLGRRRKTDLAAGLAPEAGLDLGFVASLAVRRRRGRSAT